MTGRNKPVLLVDDDTVRTYTMGEKDRTTRKKIAFKPKHEEKLAYEQAVGGCFPRLTHTWVWSTQGYEAESMASPP